MRNTLQNTHADSVSVKTRDSNLELYRIIVMLLIVAHHYVVNSGLTAADGPVYADPLSWRYAQALLPSCILKISSLDIAN